MLNIDIVLCILATAIIFTCFLAFLSSKFGRPLESLQLNLLCKHLPWITAILILLDFTADAVLMQFQWVALNSHRYELINTALGIIRAGLSVWLLLGLANALYAWLCEILPKKSLAYSCVAYIKNGMRYTFVVLSLPFVIAGFPTYPPAVDIIEKAINILVIWSVAWLVIQVISAIEKVASQRLQRSMKDNFEARSIYTQARVFKRIVVLIVVLLALGATAMVFDSVRALGTSILASAGLATVIVGFAAQKTLGNLIVGIQVAVTQPMRINDTIIIEGEQGTVEEITLSHVIVRIWDLRRMVIPISYFIDKPFQNLTRTSTELLSPIFFYADYTLPVEPVRQAFVEMVQQSPLWDGKTATLLVVEANGNAIKLRGVASAQDSTAAMNLRCDVLEKLLAFIAKNYPHSLPQARNVNLPE